jgi:tetratricopeptide (TPR) repeat protein
VTSAWRTALLIAAVFSRGFAFAGETAPTVQTASNPPTAAAPASASTAKDQTPAQPTALITQNAAEASKAFSPEQAKSTAVALNYCRAAFHRIRQSPTKVVMAEEQEKILNNLNLSSIQDPEVINLYSGVLDEINQIGLADYERKLLKENFQSTVRKKLTWDALAFSTDLATAQFGSAVRNGANSWWDYRVTTVQKDIDMLKVDRARMTAVVQKSSQFLDTFWRLAQKKQIPDKWLVRGDDIDALDKAVREPDPIVRQRVLRRMAGFMEAYPPYWYYLGRTQQELGELDDAMRTYDQLVQLGDKHFRKDDMLATGLANKAAIQEYLNDPSAVSTALKALDQSTDVWEANLVCARVLQRHRQFVAAEDAVLRNLDVGLEHEQSRVFLVSVYYYSEDRGKLAKTLADPAFANIPRQALIRCAALLGAEQTPSSVLRMVAQSIDAQPQITFGQDEVLLHASDAWQLPLAHMKATINGVELTAAHAQTITGGHELRLTPARDLGSPLGGSQKYDLKLDLTYPDASTVSLTMALSDEAPRQSPQTRMTAFRGPAAPTLRVSSIQIGDKTLSVAGTPHVEAPAALPPEKPTPPAVDPRVGHFPRLLSIEADGPAG